MALGLSEYVSSALKLALSAAQTKEKYINEYC